MGTRLLLSSATPSHVFVYPENSSDQSFRAILGAKLRGTETQLVMADSCIVGNVVQPLARSVVEPSTTDIDANNSISQLAASGESSTNSTPAIPQQTDLQSEQDNKENNNAGPYSDEATVQAGSSGLMNSKYAGTKDTDTDSVGMSRPGSISPTKVDVIKPKAPIRKTTFKSVSVNRAFLKDSAPTAGLVSNTLSSPLSNKASTAFSAPQPAARNVLNASKLKKLVKTVAPSQTSRPGSAGPAGPAGSKKAEQVWNKNLPTPPPPKKDVTDEELKLEFGIRLASRLVSDNESKEAKWADIDDDDDDWVPEAIEWNDGMKVTMDDAAATVTAMNTETVVSLPTYVEPAPEPVMEVAPPESPEHTPAVLAREEVRPKTLVTEKPSPKPAEPPSAHLVPASPWAIIQPSSVGPPAVTNHNLRNNDFSPPSLPLPRHEFGTEPSAQHASSSSAGIKEVSADVYDRSWRDRPVNHGARERELFNSETGQLEPVREVRNGGSRPNRNDAPIHKHSVLQRPSGPAEPSAAFQQSRSSMSFHRPEDYERRRASSNVSGGSGSTGGRRPSFSTGRFSADQPPTPDDARFPGPNPRRGSFGYNNPFDNEGSRGNYVSSSPYSPQFQHPSPRMAVVSPVMSHLRPSVTQPLSTQQMPPPPFPPAPVVDPNYEDPIIVQERIMKESREQARKRKQEEEAREEAAKQERLRIKLEALEREAKLKEEEETAKRKAIEEKAEAEREAAEEKRLAEEKAAAEKKAAGDKAAAERRAEEEAAAEKAAEERLALEKERPSSNRQVREPLVSLVRSRSPGDAAGTPTGPHMQGRRQSGQMQSQRSPTKNFADLGNRESRDQSWKNVSSGPDRYSSWGSSGNNSQTQNSIDGNPWGPIGEKPRYSGFNGVGNGTFDNRYSGFSARSNAPSAMHGQQNRDDGRQGGRLSRSGPTSPGFSRGPRPNDSISQEDRSQAVNRWNFVANNLQEDEVAVRRRNQEERLAREAKEAATGVKRDPIVLPKIVETHRKVELNDGQGQIDRKLVAVSKTERDEVSVERDAFPVSGTSNLPGPSTVAGATTQPATTNSQFQRSNVPTGSAASRPASRFFPAAAANLLAQHLGSSSTSVDESTPKLNPPGSPPPPMSSEHPVHGDTNSRVVHLPPSPQSQNARGRISPGSRLNNGYHKTDNPKSPHVVPVPSCSSDFEVIQRKILESIEKVTHMQHSPQQQSVRPHTQDSKVLTSKDFSETKPSFEGMRESMSKPSVSLPSSSHGSKDSSEKGETSVGEAQMDGGCILSKPDDEEFFHGLFERDFGSTPTVKIPHHHIYNATLSKSPASPLQKSRKPSRSGVDIPQTIGEFDPFDRQEFVNGDGKPFIQVHLPGGKQVEVVCKAEVVSRVQEGKQHRKKALGHRNKAGRPSHRDGGYMGRGNVRNGKRVAETVQ